MTYTHSLWRTILCGVLLLCGWATQQPAIFLASFVIGGYSKAREGLLHWRQTRQLSVDLLMVLAAIGAALINYWLEGALLIFIFAVSGLLEEITLEKNTRAITALLSHQETDALKKQLDGSYQQAAVTTLAVGDIIMVPKGSVLPIDGILLDEGAYLDQSAITGEALPVFHEQGALLYGGTLNVGEPVCLSVAHVSSETLFAKLIALVAQAQQTPSPTASYIKKLENYYVLFVLWLIPIAFVCFLTVFSWPITEAFYRSMVLLTVVSPCALIASATPATLAAMATAAKKGVIFKTGTALEQLSHINALVCDKTGTVTQGRPTVAEWTGNDTLPPHLWDIVFSMEQHSTHPLAQAIRTFAHQQGGKAIPLTNYTEHVGQGLSAKYRDDEWRIGKHSFACPDSVDNNTLTAQQTVYIGCNQQWVACVTLNDPCKPEARAVINYFKQQGCHTILLTGDHPHYAQNVATQLGFERVIANCMPQDKVTHIQRLQQTYPVLAMVGDGINDAPALALATIGIAIGSGADIAIDTANVVLRFGTLTQLTECVKLSRRLNRIVWQNIAFSLLVIAILFIANLNQSLNLPLGVIGHEGSTLLVLLNSLRLLRSSSASS